MLFYPYLRTDPDPVLRTKAVNVSVFDDNLKRKAAAMDEIRRHFNGVGLAAQQVGYLTNLAIIENLGPVVNLSVLPDGPETQVAEEGCLSLPGICVPVERYAKVIITGQDLKGGEIKEKAEGYQARIIQHEHDHLCGLLIVDRLRPEQRRRLLY